MKMVIIFQNGISRVNVFVLTCGYVNKCSLSQENLILSPADNKGVDQSLQLSSLMNTFNSFPGKHFS